ncbi:MAG: GTP-sensing pleiotropic transcriptional regulator CodY [Firmicutes bacterium]|nr:GTP-sensing pleiotropic transcriptional regulator CodY [Bacillota bacterium]
MKSILEKVREINKLLQKSAGNAVDFTEMAVVLRNNIVANVYILGRHGKVLGFAFMKGFQCPFMHEVVQHRAQFPGNFNLSALAVTETRANVSGHSHKCMFEPNDEHTCQFPYKMITIVPIVGGGVRLGTLVLGKGLELPSENEAPMFNEEDLVLAEYGATVVGMEILRAKAEEAEEEARQRAAVQIALGTLSYSEREAVEHIFAELEGNEGLLVASKIADRAGITRSVIVSALRKFESAGVIESKSLGMKGTYIRVLNDNLFEELNRTRN